jgi:hypothetical protein
MPWKHNGRTIQIGRAWLSDDGVAHPAQWNNWSNEIKAANGLIWEPDPVVEPYDKRFFWSANNPKALEDVAQTDEAGNPVLDENGNQVVAKGLKSQWIANTKQTAHNLLKPTDWLILRALVNPLNPVPLVVSQYRSAVTNRSSAIETLIQSRQTHAEFVAMFDAPVDADGSPTGNPPIHNWPDNTIQEYER